MSTSKSNSTKNKPKATSAAKASTEKARREAIKEIDQRLAKDAPLHEATIVRGDGTPVKVSVPRDEPEAGAGRVVVKGPAQPTQAGKPAKARKSPGDQKEPRPMGGLDAAAEVLKGAKEPMTCKQIWAAIDARKLWFTEGKTPEATIYSAMIREIAARKSESRFRKADRGRFALRGA